MNSIMRLLSGIVLAVVIPSVYAETPAWIDSDSRETIFPRDVYYTGFAVRDFVDSPSESLSKAANDAFADLSNSISSEVTSEAVQRLSIIDDGANYLESEALNIKSSIVSSSFLADVAKKEYVDNDSHIVYVLAFVTRDDLLRHYESSIELISRDAQSAIADAKAEIARGDKSKALNSKVKLDEMILRLAKLCYALAAVSKKSPDTAMLDSLNAVSRELASRLSKGIVVYVGEMRGALAKPTGVVMNKLKGALANHGCTFSDNPKEADYIVWIAASTRAGNVFDGVHHNFAEVSLKVTNVLKEADVYNDIVSAKGSALSDAAASGKSLDNVIGKLTEKILTVVKQ